MRIITDKRFYVYAWYKEEDNQIFYIGKGTGKRKDVMTGRNNYFINTVNKYSCLNKIIEDNLSESEAYEREKFYIKYYWSIGRAQCNITEGGLGASSGLNNPVHRRCKKELHEHLRKARQKQKDNPNYKNPFSYMKFYKEDNHFYGKKHTEESKKRISESRKGKGGRFGKDNPMYGKGFFGKDNPMYGIKRDKHPNVHLYEVLYVNGSSDVLTYKECEKKFGIAFSRVDNGGGTLNYLSKSKNSIWEGTQILDLGKVNKGKFKKKI